MKSSWEIRIDFQNAIAQATALENLANDIERKVAGKLTQSAQSIHAAWKGESASQYINKTMDLCKQVQRTVTTLRDTASDIRRIAKQIYDAEQRALEIASRRNG